MMQAVIFAAGNSTRTMPLTSDRPKPLLKVAGKTIIEHNLAELAGLVKSAIIIIGYKGDMIKDVLKTEYHGIKLSYVVQEELNGTGGALLSAKDMLDNRFLVMNGDDLFSKEDIKRCLNHETCILGKEVDDL